jgi:hypothetical protein
VFEGIDILDGYFTVDIPVPIEAFEGSARLIEIGVRPGILEDPNAYTFMEPLQKIMPTPYALYSVKAGFSEDSNSLDGMDSSDFASSFHLHSGEDIATGTVAEARIDAAVARDTEIIPEVLANDGSGSGLDADLLDGMDSSFFSASAHLHDAADIVSGILNVNRYSSFSDLGNEGYLGDSVGDIAQNNGVLQPTLNADMLDGLHGTSYFILNQNETVSGRPYFYGGTTGSTPPFYVDSTYIVSGLNADYLDGYHAGSFVLTSADFGRSGVSNTLYEGITPIANKYVNVTGDNMTGTLGINESVAGVSYGIDVASSSSGSSAYGGDFSAYCQSTSTGSVVGTRNYGYHYGTSGTTYGTYSYCYGSDTGDSYGIRSTAYKYSSDTSGYAYGGYFVGDNDRTGGASYGVYADATGLNGDRYGVYSDVDTSGTSIFSNYGFYSDTTNNNGPSYGGLFRGTTGATNTWPIYGVYGYGNHFGPSGNTYGTAGFAYGSDIGDGIGSYGYGHKSSTDTGGDAYGGYFLSDNDRIGQKSYGVYTKATGANGYRYGVYSDISASGYYNYGFYADITSSSGYAYGGYFNPDLTGGTGGLYGLYCGGSHGGTSGSTYGLYTSMSGSDTGSCFGVYSYAAKYSSDTGGTSYGGYFFSYNDGTGDTYGVYASTDGFNGINYGVYSEADAYDGYYGYGFYADIDGASDGANPYGFYADLDSSNSYTSYGLYINSDKKSTTATGDMYGSYFYVNHNGTSGTVRGVGISAWPSNTGSIYGLYSYIWSAGTSSSVKYAGYFVGNVHVSGTLTATAKPFVQPHKTDPTKEIVYISVESREHVVVIRGKATLTNGVAVIEMPGDWIQVAAGEGITVNLTPMGQWAPLYTESATLSEVVVRSASGGPQDVTFSYYITALRDGFESHEPIQDNIHFTTQDTTIEKFEERFAGDSLDRRAIREMLISNGTLTETGELNIETAESLGWELENEPEEVYSEEAEEERPEREDELESEAGV